MTPAAMLPVVPGDRVLDLCAAPGGKSTELASKLKGRGMLVSNDISYSRARALLKNLELAGAANICVTSSQTPSVGTVVRNEYGMLVLSNEARTNITFVSSCSIDLFLINT